MTNFTGFLFTGGFGIIMLIAGFSFIRKRRAITNTPTSKIRSLAMGLVEINGKIESMAENTLKSPFTETECVYYEYKIEVRSKKGWQRFGEGREGKRFNVNDGTGTITVDPTYAETEIQPTYQFETGNLELPRSIKTFMSNKYHNQNPERVIARYTECVLSTGKDIYVMGDATHEAAQSDEPDKVVVKFGTYNKILYISSLKEKEIITKMKKNIIVLLIFGFAFLIGGIAFLL